MMTIPVATPVPPHLSDEERALWEKAVAVEAAAAAYDAITDAASKGEHHVAYTELMVAQEAFDPEPSVIRSLLTALSSEREAGERDRKRLDWLEAQLRPLPWGGVFALIESDGDSQFRFTMQPASGDAPFLNETGATLRDAIDASRGTANDGDCHDCGMCPACIERTESNYLDACAALDDSPSTETPHD